MPKSSPLFGYDNPPIATADHRSIAAPVAAATLSHLSSRTLVHLVIWLAGIIRRLGDLVFMATDEEAYWRGWAVERRQAGLSRRYRDPVFDTVTQCLHCRGLGITAEESPCARCSGTGRVMVDQPPFPRHG